MHTMYSFQMCIDGSFSSNWRLSLNKLARQIQSQLVKLQYWALTGPLRILVLVLSDASYRNNDDGSSQRGMTVFSAESRGRSSRDGVSYGNLIDYESQKIKKTALSTAVVEQFAYISQFPPDVLTSTVSEA